MPPEIGIEAVGMVVCLIVAGWTFTRRWFIPAAGFAFFAVLFALAMPSGS